MIDQLFEVLSGYLNFIIDLLFFGDISKYSKIGVIDPTIFSYFITGSVFAFIFANSKKIPGYLKYTKETSATGDKDSSIKEIEVASFVFLSVFGAMIFHFVLFVYNSILGKEMIGNIKDTLNAVFAYNALYHPINAILQRISNFLNEIARKYNFSKFLIIMVAILLFIISLTYFASLIYLLYCLAVLHDTSILYMIGPALILIIPTLIVTISYYIVTSKSKA